MAESANNHPHLHQLESVPESRVLNNDKLADEPTGLHPPSPITTRRTRRLSLNERAMEGEIQYGAVKYFCRQRGHGFVTPQQGGDDIFVHVSDIEGEFVPHAGDEVAYKLCPCPPKFESMQAIHVTIKNLAPGTRHERWDQPPEQHKHPHPQPNTAESRQPPPSFD